MHEIYFEDLLKHRWPGWTPKFSDSVGLLMCIANELLDEAAPAGLDGGLLSIV